ncbi:hypothetical protein [Vibrio phage LP.2]|nr:hypothetical protein [Vibrio phage LP.2]
MWSIKKYYNERDFVEFKVSDMAKFMRDNIEEFKAGYRFYSGAPSQESDITEDPCAIVESSEIIMLKPAHGLVGIVVGAIIASVVVAAVAVKLLTPKIEAPSNQNRSQSSATNALGDRTNEAAIGSRRDDIYGRVNNHTPRLIQVPHVRFESNSEVEYFAVHVTNGKGLMENVRDGETQYSSLPGGKFNAWYPGGNPNNGIAPDLTIGGLIDRPLANISLSRELQAAELLPPNDLEVANIDWRLTTSDNGDGTYEVTVFGSNIVEKELSLTDYITAGQNFFLFDFFVARNTTTIDLYNAAGTAETFQEVNLFEFSGQYNADSVTDDTVVFTSSNADFANWTNAPSLYTSYFTENGYPTGSGNYVAFLTLESKITNNAWYSTNAGSGGAPETVMTYLTSTYLPSAGTISTNILGPIRIPDDADDIWLNLVSNNGFYKLVDNNERAIQGEVNVIFSGRDINDQPIGVDTVIPVDYNSNSQSITKQAAISADFNKAQWDVTVGAEYYVVSAQRVTPRDKSSNVTSVDKIIWRDCYFSTDIGTQDYGDVTMAQCVIPSSITAQSVKERRVNMDVTRFITPYVGNGQFGPEAPVETWAETLIAICLDPLNGRITLDEVDADLLLEVQQQMISYYGNPDYVKVGYDLDSTKLRFQDIYELFCNAVNVRAYSQGAVYRGYPDIKRDISSKQFTHRNKVVGTDSKERLYTIDNDGIELKYRSNDTGGFETIILHVNGVSSTNRLNIELSGATQEVTAQVRAYRELNILKYQKYNFNFEADGIARLTVPGERVDNVDNTRIVKRENNTNIYQIYDGLVVSQNGLEIELSQPVTFTDGELHTIRFTNSKGDLLEAIECAQGSTDYHVVLAQAPSETIYTGYKREKTNFTFCADNLRSALPIIVRGTKAKETKGLRTRQVSGINWDTRYYQNDQDFVI